MHTTFLLAKRHFLKQKENVLWKVVPAYSVLGTVVPRARLYGALNENGFLRLTCLNIWSQVAGAVWPCSGSVSLGIGFEVSKGSSKSACTRRPLQIMCELITIPVPMPLPCHRGHYLSVP